MMKSLQSLTSSTVVLPQENIDTDQIIPARFLTAVNFEGLGKQAFADWRFDASGKAKPDCVLNDPLISQRKILVAGHNFGCGSSREHAPRALLDFGIRAIISSEVADIFKSNAYQCGLLPIVITGAEYQWLLDHPGAEVTIDLNEQYIELPIKRFVYFEIDAFSKHCLMQGVDKLGYLLSQSVAINQFEEQAV